MLSSIRKRLSSILRYIFYDILKSVHLYSKYRILLKINKTIVVLGLVFFLSSPRKRCYRLPWQYLVSIQLYCRHEGPSLQYTSHGPSQRIKTLLYQQTGIFRLFLINYLVLSCSAVNRFWRFCSKDPLQDYTSH